MESHCFGLAVTVRLVFPLQQARFGWPAHDMCSSTAYRYHNKGRRADWLDKWKTSKPTYQLPVHSLPSMKDLDS